VINAIGLAPRACASIFSNWRHAASSSSSSSSSHNNSSNHHGASVLDTTLAPITWSSRDYVFSHYYAAVLEGRISLSVCPVRATNSATHGVEIPKSARTFPEQEFTVNERQKSQDKISNPCSGLSTARGPCL